MKLIDLFEQFCYTESMDYGLYVEAKFNDKTLDDLTTFMRIHKIPDMVSRDKLHTSIVFSRNWVPFKPALYRLNIDPSTYHWEVLGPEDNCLVLAYESLELEERFIEAMSLGATFDHDEFIPHVTLSYNAIGVNPDKLPLPKFPMCIVNEVHKANNPNWLDKP